tara:strand:- start:3696 stop:4619 length:924 start_codon:yes stop_codon:yes gene_type:complete
MARSDGDIHEHDYTVPPSTLETIDEAVVKYIKDTMSLFSTTNKGWKKVPVIWVAHERTHQRKKNKELRDDHGALILPLITIERVALRKDPIRKGGMGVHVPKIRDAMQNQFTVGRVINQKRTSDHEKARRFKKHGNINAPDVGRADRNKRERDDSKKNVVYDYISIPLPVYVDSTYKISIRTGYQQQQNEILTPFLTRSGQKNDFKIKGENHHYVAHFEADITKNNNVSDMQEGERVYECEVSLIVNGYLIGDGPNQDQPKVVRRMGATKIHYGRERSILGDINEWMEDDDHRGKLREQLLEKDRES